MPKRRIKKILPSTRQGLLTASDERYHKLLERMTDGFISVNMEGIILETNLSFQKMVGYDSVELKRLTYRDLTPDQWHSFEQKIVEEEILQKGYSYVYEKEYWKKDGTVFPVELRTFLIRSEAGGNEGMWAIVRDISERKKSEEIRKENDYWLKESQRFGRLGSYSLDLTTKMWTSSEVLDDIFGIEPIPYKTIDTWEKILHPDNREEMINYLMNHVIAGKNTFDKEYRIIRECDEEERWVWGNGILSFDNNGSVLKMFGIIQDITERKRINEAVIRSETEYRNTLDALPECVYVVDENLRFIMVNHSLKEEFIHSGFTKDCIGKKINSNFPFISLESIKEIRQVFNTGEILISEEKFDLQDKTTMYCGISKVPVFKDNKVIKVITVVRDRSKEKEIEVLKQKSMEEKDIFLREIHHRVKNNLAIVISLLNFQVRKSTIRDLVPIINEIELRIRSMALIHEHLYLSENIDRIPLASYIQSLTHIILAAFSGYQVKIETRLDPMDVSIETALPIGLIINELLTNAFKYAFVPSKAGKIKIILQRGENDNCTLTVKDNGIGLPLSYSVESSETMGLYIIRLLTEQLEGKFAIARRNGTSFILRFRNNTKKK